MIIPDWKTGLKKKNKWNSVSKHFYESTNKKFSWDWSWPVKVLIDRPDKEKEIGQ